jgi:hypothetical protein
MKYMLSITLLLLQYLQIQAQADCKLKRDQLKPIIRNYSPWYYRLTWDDKTKTETAWAGNQTEIKISQSGCDRHHTAFVFKTPISEIPDNTADTYWPEQLFCWLDNIYEYNSDWMLFRLEFRKQLLRFYEANAEPGQSFNFPVLERNFFYYETRHEDRKEIHLEIVKYLYNEKIKRPGRPEDE